MKTAYKDIPAYTTKDGSLIRELMHPGVHAEPGGPRGQSLAEAEVPAGGSTLGHSHTHSEEFYHVTQGRGRLFLGPDSFVLEKGDTVCIAPGVVHSLENTGTEPLKVLCCCTPPYSHEDTVLEPES